MSSELIITKWYNFISKRTSIIVFSLVLLYIFIRTLPLTSLSHILAWGLLFIGYQSLIWVPASYWNPYRRVLYMVVLWGATLTAWVAFDMRETAVAMVYCLAGYIALKLPKRAAYIIIAMIVASYAGLELAEGVRSLDSLLLTVSNLIGIYVIMWGFRVRHEATELSKQHYRELSLVHAELKQTHEELQAAHLKLEQGTVDTLRYAVLEERSRIARDIHDSIGHGLTSVIVQLQALPYVIKANTAEADATVRTVLEVARGCLKEVRTVVHEMAIDEADLGIIALKSLVKQVQSQSGLSITLSTPDTLKPWSPIVSEALYRIVQEALTNVIRHADASEVAIHVEESDYELVMHIQDDGSYREDEVLSAGFGMQGMKARCEKIKGQFQTQAREPHGLLLSIAIPLAG